jgi:tRNA pseudouridine55 synthase
VSFNGILNVNKPKGRTSTSIVGQMRRLSHEKHVGHAGTLDPIASGVLPVGFGKSTKIVPFLMSFPKTYEAEIRLGVCTDTYDDLGTVTSTSDPSVATREKVLETLASFRGNIDQAAPVFSAIRYNGAYGYNLARAGVSMVPRVRQVRIDSIELLTWKPPMFTIRVTCSKGTYMRSLAHELGQRLGCGACMSALVRLAYGPFAFDKSSSLDEIEDAFAKGTTDELLQPDETVFSLFPSVTLAAGQSVPAKKYSPMPSVVPPDITGQYCRLISESGRLEAVLTYDSSAKQWVIARTFPRPPSAE